jgi:thymidylate synthase
MSGDDATAAATALSICIEASSLGRGWLSIVRQILSRGVAGRYDGLPMREVILATLTVSDPDPADALIHRLADPIRLAWMHENFTDHGRVAALGDADSYATRLLDYDHRGLDQLTWVVQRLQSDPLSRSATITTLQPLSDTTYIPCVSMLDFWLSGGALELAVYAHSIDFGAKGYGNLVELAAIQQNVATRLGVAVGSLTMIVKSAHVYDTELEYLEAVLAEPMGSEDPRG